MNVHIPIFALLLSIPIGQATEIETKDIPPTTSNRMEKILRPVTPDLESYEERTTGTAYYRGERKVLEAYTTTTTFKRTGKEPDISVSEHFRLFANGRRILQIYHPDLRPYEVSSPWPIVLHHNVEGKDGDEVWYYISIPEIDYFELLRFKGGKLLPLREGELYNMSKSSFVSLTSEQIEK